jgi:hypothetical protein
MFSFLRPHNIQSINMNIKAERKDNELIKSYHVQSEYANQQCPFRQETF